MYHVPLATQDAHKEIDYASLSEQPTKRTPTIPEVGEDEDLPEAPPGFAYHRVAPGDTLMSIGVRYNVSQGRLKRYNREACFGTRLAHIRGKLLLIPLSGDAQLTADVAQQVADDFKERQGTDDGSTRKEPDEAGKYQLRKAFMMHTGVDSERANYYLGDAAWHLRTAITTYQGDAKWEKQNTVAVTLRIAPEAAKELLELNKWDTSAAIKYFKKHNRGRARPKKGQTGAREPLTEGAEMAPLAAQTRSQGGEDPADHRGEPRRALCC